jgi:hypothetical protein
MTQTAGAYSLEFTQRSTRMILTAAYQMLPVGEVWNPTVLYKIDMPEHLKEKQKEKAIKQAKKLLIAEGIITESQLAS